MAESVIEHFSGWSVVKCQRKLLSFIALYIMRYMAQAPSVLGIESDLDDNFRQAVEIVVQYDRASPSLLQRRLGIGYARAARITDQLEAAGVLGPAEGSKPRDVLIHSAEEVLKGIPEKKEPKEEPRDDEYLEDAVRVVIQYDRSSASLLQRRLAIGYAKAARLIDQLEELGVVGPARGAEPREVLVKSYEEFEKKRDAWAKKEQQYPSDTLASYSMSKSLKGPYSGFFDNFSFWIKVLKISLPIFITHLVFGFEAALLVGLVMVCLFLSKISLTLQDINKELKSINY